MMGSVDDGEKSRCCQCEMHMLPCNAQLCFSTRYSYTVFLLVLGWANSLDRW